MKTFYSDVASGTLPLYAFIEPRMIFNNNDYHPPAPSIVYHGIVIGGISDVRAGDLLAHQVYSAVRESDAQWGSNALNTLLLLTFDEHGGCYDHVAPPVAIPPELLQPEGEKGFFFDRLGVRVPAIAISAYTEVSVPRPVPPQSSRRRTRFPRIRGTRMCCSSSSRTGSSANRRHLVLIVTEFE